jgi:hypothetical protein
VHPCYGCPYCWLGQHQPPCSFLLLHHQNSTHKLATTILMQIYCEKIRDLFCPSKDNLTVVRDASGVSVAEATALPVASEQQCMELMESAIANRAVSATAMNEGSSRSHCVVRLHVERVGTDGAMHQGKLCLVVRWAGDHEGNNVWGRTHCLSLTICT